MCMKRQMQAFGREDLTPTCEYCRHYWNEQRWCIKADVEMDEDDYCDEWEDDGF